MMVLWRLYVNELIKAFSKWRTYIGFVAIGVGVTLAMWGFSVGGSSIQRDMLRRLGDEFITTGNLVNGMWVSYLLMNTLFIHIPFLITLVAGDVVAGEGTAGTFRIYLTRPVSRTRVLTSKLCWPPSPTPPPWWLPPGRYPAAAGTPEKCAARPAWRWEQP